MADVEAPLPVPAPLNQTLELSVTVGEPEPVAAIVSNEAAEAAPVDDNTRESTVEGQSAQDPEIVVERPGAPQDSAGTLDPSNVPAGGGDDGIERVERELVESVPELDLEIYAFPFSGEDQIDPGVRYTGTYICWEPETIESNFPFYGVGDEFEELREIAPSGNLTTFLVSGPHCHEYHRNYLRGDTLKQLRLSKNFKPLVPGGLRKFLDLPVELLYDILELLHPLDLLHLSRTTKKLKLLLTATRAKEVWAASYRNHIGHVAMPHRSIPALQWTAMLYCSAVCDFCGRKGALMDFALKERYCDPCQSELLKDRREMRRKLEDYPREAQDLYDLVVPTYRQCGQKYQTSYESAENARYREKDIMAMLKELHAWYMTIDEGVIPEAAEKFEEWKQLRRGEIEYMNIHAQLTNNWAMNLSYHRNSEHYELQQKLAKKISDRLLRMGLDAQDVETANNDFYYVLRTHELLKLNGRIFEQLKDELVSKVMVYKRARLKRERRERAVEVYNDYKKTLKPERWQYMPPEDIVLNYEPFDSFIDNPPEDSRELTLEQVKATVPLKIEEWIGERRLELYQMVPGHEMPAVEAEPEPEGLSDEQRAANAEERELLQKQILNILMDQRMGLATTVYSCTTCKSGRPSAKALIGWDAACSHLCGSFPNWHHTNFEFCSVGYAAAANIIRSMDMAPETTTPADLDAIDARFFCLNCPVTLHRKVRGRKAYTWRECVQHAVEKEEDHGHAISSWARLSAETTVFVKSHESPAPVFRKENWGCNHCAEHFKTPVHRKDAIAHVKTAHSIETPVDGVDFIDFKHRYEKGGHYRRRHIFHFGVEPTCNLVCKICRSGKQKKMWTTLNLIPHLFHKHGISMPSSSRDYYKIPVFHGD